jgi:hypothetical protein
VRLSNAMPDQSLSCFARSWAGAASSIGFATIPTPLRHIAYLGLSYSRQNSGPHHHNARRDEIGGTKTTFGDRVGCRWDSVK